MLDLSPEPGTDRQVLPRLRRGGTGAETAGDEPKMLGLRGDSSSRQAVLRLLRRSCSRSARYSAMQRLLGTTTSDCQVLHSLRHSDSCRNSPAAF